MNASVGGMGFTLETSSKRRVRLLDLYATGRITESQFERQRDLIAERLEGLRMKLDDCRARLASEAERREAIESIFRWAKEIGDGLDDMLPEQQRKVLLGIVENITVDRNNDVNITLAVSVDESMTVEPPSSRPLDRLETL